MTASNEVFGRHRLDQAPASLPQEPLLRRGHQDDGYGTLEPEFTQKYLDHRMSEHFATVADANALALVLINGVCIILDQIAAHPDWKLTFLIVRTLTILAALIYTKLRAYRDLSRLYMQFVNVAYAGFWAYMVHDRIISGQINEVALPATYYLVTAIFLILGSPFEKIVPFVVAICYLVFGALATAADFSTCYRFVLILGVALLGGYGLHWLMFSSTRSRAERELSARLQVAPTDLVRRSLTETRHNLEKSLEPRLRRCLCLASDWRGYQMLSRAMSPERLAQALEAYYGLCRKLLVRQFPQGRFFSDWIADELLIFFVVDDSEDESVVVADVLAFARSLVGAKAEFNREFGLNVAIDVGIALGDAMVGLCGPASQRKVMAIGDVSVKARAYQGLGKSLRAQSGRRDRIIFDEAVHAAASKSGINMSEARRNESLDPKLPGTGKIAVYAEEAWDDQAA